MFIVIAGLYQSILLIALLEEAGIRGVWYRERHVCGV